MTTTAAKRPKWPGPVSGGTWIPFLHRTVAKWKLFWQVSARLSGQLTHAKNVQNVWPYCHALKNTCKSLRTENKLRLSIELLPSAGNEQISLLSSFLNGSWDIAFVIDKVLIQCRHLHLLLQQLINI
jgi:hypothetical protein